MKGHLKHMLIGGAVLLVVLLVAGVDLGRALPYALLLACPLSMAGMMFMMMRKPGDARANHHHDIAGRSDASADGADTPRVGPDRERIG
ncbi:MAG: hypothetical protein EON96_09990 [Caulobacteraceae bacterium]|nr:MAG: hypothetical protein EON96_09990 [Caulobacteraceae bacterium]